jgi:hypothetical protein
VHPLIVREEIKNWQGKPKELVVNLTEKVSEDSALFAHVIQLLKTGSKVEKGKSADVIEQVSSVKPEIIEAYIDDLIEQINSDLPRVKWGICRAIGNLAQKYPSKTEKAIPKLLINTKDEGTVVRWCTAFAIGEIAKNNVVSQGLLRVKIQELVVAERNNGVRNVYLKAIKKMK